MNQQSSNSNSIIKELTDNEKFEIKLALTQLNRGERTSMDDFLRKVSDSKNSKK